MREVEELHMGRGMSMGMGRWQHSVVCSAEKEPKTHHQPLDTQWLAGFLEPVFSCLKPAILNK